MDGANAQASRGNGGPARRDALAYRSWAVWHSDGSLVEIGTPSGGRGLVNVEFSPGAGGINGRPLIPPAPGLNSTFTRPRPATRSRDLYQAPISYATQPKTDKREHLYVRAAVSAGRLGIGTIHLPCEVVRDYFYVATRHQAWERQANLYDTLRISATASPAELRLAFNLRQLELRASSASKLDRATLERAFNILAQPELRACYDSLLKDTSSPALFPYGGFGSILVAGDRSRDGHDVLRHANPIFRPRAPGAPLPRAVAQF